MRLHALSAALDDLINFKSEKEGWSDSPFPTKIKWEPSAEELHNWNYNLERKRGKKKLIPLKSLVGTQDSVNDEIVDKYVKNKSKDLPRVSQYGDKYVLRDGHHRSAAEKRKGRKKIYVQVVHSDQVLSALLDDLIQFKQLYQPTPGEEPPDAYPQFKPGEVVDYTVQRHHAKRAGFHRDIRIGDRIRGLISWATRKGVPGPGERTAVHPQPVHPHSYLGWEGEIPEGYGKGKVETEDLGKALITKSTPSEIHATLAHRRGSHRVAFLRGSSSHSGHLLVSGKAPQPPRLTKPRASSLPPDQIGAALERLGGNQVSVQPKIDGALVYVTTKGGRPEVFSHRVSKVTGQHPVHTERVFRGRPTVDIPKEDQNTLIGELYGTKKGRAIPPQDLGGILNSHIAESLSKQRAKGVKLRIMPFDLANQKGPYSERLAKVKQTLRHLPKDTFHAPEEAHTRSAVMKLYHKVRSGRHPLTSEGLMIHPESGRMIKVKNVQEKDVRIHSVFPGKGKFKGSYGGFYYADDKGRPLGKVGTGLTEETRRELPKYLGRVARVRYQDEYPSGRLRAPSLIAIHESRN